MVAPAEPGPIPNDKLKFDFVMMANVQPVEALRLIVAEPRRGCRAGLDNQCAAGALGHFPCGFRVGLVKMPRKRDMDAGLAHGFHGVTVPADGFA